MITRFQNVLNFLRRTSTKQLNLDDCIVKYIFKCKEIRADGSPRPASLKPKAGEYLSMSEVTNLTHPQVCQHGHKYVDNRSIGRVHVGYVKFIYSIFKKLNIEVVYDNCPPRHVSVILPELPELRREIAKALADEVGVIDENEVKKYFAACN